MIRILLTGGGTGGHIYPLIAVAQELKKSASQKNIELDIRYIGAPESFGAAFYEAGIPVSRIFGSKWRRYPSFQNILDIPKFAISVFQALYEVFRLMPDILFSKGGPSSFPVVFACRFYRIPVFIHESDTVPGLSNRLAARYASWIGLAFPSAQEFFGKTKARFALTGNPIRRSLFKDEPPAEAKKVLGFALNLPLILVLGSSQGAQRVNEFILDSLPILLKNFQIFHQTGVKNFDEVTKEAAVSAKNLPPEEKNRYKAVPYFDKNYSEALIAADVIVSRSSSSSIAEIAAFGKPSILIPLPESAGDHQRVNAYEYAKTGAAIVIENDNLTPNVFVNQIKQLILVPGKLEQMSFAAKQFAKPDAAKMVAEEILNI